MSVTRSRASSRRLARALALARYQRIQRLRHGRPQVAVHAHRLSGLQRRVYLCLLRFALSVCDRRAAKHSAKAC